MNTDLYESKTEPTAVILIVDDNPANLGVLFDCLDQAGFETRVARDGENALQKVAYELPDLILLDVMMPGIDGFETCQRLKSNPATHEIPVIFMSSLSEPIDRAKGLNLGAVDFMTKPVQREEVLARIHLHLKLRKLTQTLATQNDVLKREVEVRAATELALQQLTEKLEQRVESRTSELSKALQDLQQAQVQIVQTEKLAILGQIMAGVAYEINNPVGFIASNLRHAEEYLKDIHAHLLVQQQCCTPPTPPVRDHAQAIELDYLLEDFPKLMAGMRVGVERIQNISLSLHNFVRTEQSTKLPTNLHEGLDSTLLLLKHRLKGMRGYAEIEICREYGKIPLVTCYPGQLNQVFMNILTNAIDALEEAMCQGRSDRSPLIRIRTLPVTHDRVQIHIEDNGLGMTAEVSQYLFDPMFTTKPVGKGTGLGLSISRQIIEVKHQGNLNFSTTEGEGSRFEIDLPIEQH